MSVLAVIACILFLVVNDTVYYLSIKKTLTTNMESQLEAISQQIELSIDHSEYTFKNTDELMANSLRNVSIAIKNVLPSDYKDVENSKLVELARELNVSHISLFAKSGDDIVAVKSSDPKQIGMGSKSWGNYFIAFNELFDRKPISVPDGTSLEDFWAGKIAGSTSDPKSTKNKFGYYFDGTTNYIIDPYINSAYIQNIEQNTGTDSIVQKTLKNSGNLVEITGFNPLTFSLPDDDPSFFTYSNGKKNPRYSQRKILFGEYKYPDPKDAQMIAEAVRSGQTTSYYTEVNGTNVLKAFTSIRSENVQFPYVIGLTGKVDVIDQALNKQLLNFLLIIGIVTIITGSAAAIIIRYVGKTKDEVAQNVQDNYIDELNSLIVAIKGQRHDFTNHLDTILGLVEMEKYSDVQAYVNELVDETAKIHDIVDIGQPAIASLIQSKMTQSITRKVTFTYDFKNYKQNIDIPGLKSVDIVKIMGNLIDNAFDEVENIKNDERNVHVEVIFSQSTLYFSVANSLTNPVTSSDLSNMLMVGYTTKSARQHSGLGLAIVKERVARYKGELAIKNDDERMIKFEVTLPINS
ncbi:sensor histidine kinase [Paenibacillus chitinolyticus]|uniref:sensor histidine kinase n=1 Tax=Paenibacillus chitinolyticus TaxID=79263 RepID=UPI00295E5BCA|nr:GHKL domain-containing protein [Paenibacillus chitinolyticus]